MTLDADTLSRVRPDEVTRAGALLGMTADEVARAGAISQRASTVRWKGPPSERYQARLAALVRDLRGVRSAFDQAGDALLWYGRSLDLVHDQAVKALALQARAGDERVLSMTLHGSAAYPPEVQHLQDQADALVEDANQQHAGAAARLVNTLRDLADRAPREGRATAISRGIDHIASSLGHAVTFPFVAAKDAAQAATGHGTGPLQEDLTSLLPWTGVESLVAELHEHEWSDAGGDSLAIVLLHGRKHLTESMRRYGGHDLMDPQRLATFLRVVPTGPAIEVDRWLVTRGRAQFLQLMGQHVASSTLLPLDAFLTARADLMLHDALGGHTLLRHVGRDIAFLRQRQAWHLKDEGVTSSMSTFATINDAERAVTRALRTVSGPEYRRIADALRRGVPITVSLPLVGTDIRGRVLAASGELREPSKVKIRIVPGKNGFPLIDSAWLS